MCVCAKKQKEVARTLFCFGVVWWFFGGAGGGGEEVGASVFFGFGRKQREGALVVYLLLCVEGDDAERHALRPSYLSGKERWREVERAPRTWNLRACVPRETPPFLEARAQGSPARLLQYFQIAVPLPFDGVCV